MKALSVFLCLVFLSISVFANSLEEHSPTILNHHSSSAVDTTKKKSIGAFDEFIGGSKSGDVENMNFTTSAKAMPSMLEYIKRPKLLPTDFTGYKIELLTVYNEPLLITDELFKTFGGITFQHKTTTSTTYYLGGFEDKEALEEYLIKILKPRFPEAKGVKFKEGEEVKYK